MEYHLPRVFEWINRTSVDLYPTIDRQQLDMPPWAEYAMLHADILYGGDRLVNLVQWLSYVGCAIGVSLIAKELGGGEYTQLFAGLLCATIPSGVLGASGPKNDCVLAYWITLSAYFLLTWRREQSWTKTIALGSTFALSIFTKGTAFAFLPGLVIPSLLIWSGLARRRFLIRLPVIAAICLVILAPFWLRNYKLSGSIFGLPYFDGAGPIEGRMFKNSHITPPQTAANMVRNIALHLGTPSDKANAQITRLLSGLISALGVNPNDPGQLVASQFGFVPQFGVPFGWRQEVFAGNPVHLLLLCGAYLFYLLNLRKLERRVGWLGLSIIAGFILYSALLRWGPWNARYQLPLFVLAAPFTAMVLTQFLPPRVVQAIMYLLLLTSVPLAAVNQSRPLVTHHGFHGNVLTVPRENTYFFDQHREMASSFISAARFASHLNCRSVGLDANLLHFEYPMLALLSGDGVSRRIVYSSVQNSTTRFATNVEPPCLIVCLGCVGVSEKWSEYRTPANAGFTFGNYVAVMPVETKSPDKAH